MNIETRIFLELYNEWVTEYLETLDKYDDYQDIQSRHGYAKSELDQFLYWVENNKQ